MVIFATFLERIISKRMRVIMGDYYYYCYFLNKTILYLLYFSKWELKISFFNDRSKNKMEDLGKPTLRSKHCEEVTTESIVPFHAFIPSCENFIYLKCNNNTVHTQCMNDEVSYRVYIYIYKTRAYLNSLIFIEHFYIST